MRLVIMTVMAASGMLAGCNRPSIAVDDGRARGRFGGIGVYDAGRVWQQMAAKGSADRALARLADDEHVIAVIDSRTGEVRQCGDHSGYCVAMNPWAGAPPPGLPVRLLKHAVDIETEQGAAVDNPSPVRPAK